MLAAALGAAAVRRDAALAVMSGVAVGHVLFVVMLRSAPLGAVALRVLPVRFGRAVWALVRGPGVLSLGCMLAAAAVGLAFCPGAGRMALPAVLALLGLDAVYLAMAVNFVGRPGLAALAHGVGLYAAAESWARLGMAEAVAGALLLAWLWHRAARMFHHGGTPGRLGRPDGEGVR
ncbi:hypothetical protein [Nguyenibacter sp. L1]|uniref:hypothetical protein n=1 Tax=Nguyenibacter sp. L1 TaxID=3049350 RepID=UPI002B481228|nr:hypothetical protein [Nguyenibacter sp. L1]WRH89515.1 hypothetical protein QN315_07970 [Nguyenibacter sp. L1]